MPYPVPRPQATADLLGYVASCITERDRSLVELLLEHQVLTTNQIATALFDSRRRAQRRLLQLHALRMVDRVRPWTEVGSAPFHWVLDETGAQVIAAVRGVSSADLPWRRDRALAVAHSSRLPHLVGVNGVFADLLGYARTHPDHSLPTWWSEQRCAQAIGQVVRPDAYGIWQVGTRRCGFFLEYDRGTEPVARVVAKLDGYARLAAVRGPTTVAIYLPSALRERNLRRAIARHALTRDVLTTYVGAGHPAAASWLSHSEQRTSLLSEPAE